jgi:hypothetical protein
MLGNPRFVPSGVALFSCKSKVFSTFNDDARDSQENILIDCGQVLQNAASGV